jgi:hypothetical protein
MFTRKIVLKQRKEKHYEEEPEIILPINMKVEESFTNHKPIVETSDVNSDNYTESFKTEQSVTASNTSLQNICLNLNQYIQTVYGGLGSLYPISTQTISQLRKDQQVLDTIIEKTKAIYVHSRSDSIYEQSSKNHAQRKQSMFKINFKPFKKTVASFDLLDDKVKTLIYDKAEAEWLKISKKANPKGEDTLIPVFDAVHFGSTLADLCITVLNTMEIIYRGDGAKGGDEFKKNLLHYHDEE